MNHIVKLCEYMNYPDINNRVVHSDLFVINYVDNFLSKLNIDKINFNTDVKSLIKLIEIIKI